MKTHIRVSDDLVVIGTFKTPKGWYFWTAALDTYDEIKDQWPKSEEVEGPFETEEKAIGSYMKLMPHIQEG